MTAPRNKIKIFVASTVYNFQPQLDSIYELLDGYGYDVLNSHKGTILVDSEESNLDNCINGVKECDVFIGLIRPDYGSGIIGDLSITHQEFKMASSLAIPKFILADSRVVFARSLLRSAVAKNGTDDIELTPENVTFNKKIMDIRCIHLYDEMVKNKIPPFDRKGNWVQEYYDIEQIRLFLDGQFKYPERIKALIEKINKLP
jgi:hypothetical protein